MAKKNDLDFLIDDIRLMSTQQAMNDTLEYQIDGIIVSVLERMGMETIVDTGQARSMFVEIAKLFDRDIGYILDTDYSEYWGNDRGIFDGFDSNVDIMDTYGRYVDIDIYDDGLYSQEMSGIDPEVKGQYPSSFPDRANNYQPNHLTMIADMANDGNLSEFEAEIEKAINKIIIILNGR